MPRPMAATFFAAVQYSTPARSSVKTSWYSAVTTGAPAARASSSDVDAHTAAEGTPEASSEARQGPATATNLAPGISSATTSDILRPLSVSTPLASDTTKRASPTT